VIRFPPDCDKRAKKGDRVVSGMRITDKTIKDNSSAQNEGRKRYC
jgi:hypothetical protein